MANLPRCAKYKGCFANKDGYCMCLKETDFGGRKCPFYKSGKKVSMKDLMEACRAYALTHGEGGGE